MDKLVLSPEKARAERDRAVLPNVTIVMPGSSPVAPVGELPGQLAASALTPRPCALAPGAPPGRTGESTAFPPITAQVANLFREAVAFVGDGCAMVDDAQYRQRLEVCRTCDHRVGKRCTACGCWIGLKARGRAFTCPLDRWPKAGE